MSTVLHLSNAGFLINASFTLLGQMLYERFYRKIDGLVIAGIARNSHDTDLYNVINISLQSLATMFHIPTKHILIEPNSTDLSQLPIFNRRLHTPLCGGDYQPNRVISPGDAEIMGLSCVNAHDEPGITDQSMQALKNWHSPASFKAVLHCYPAYAWDPDFSLLRQANLNYSFSGQVNFQMEHDQCLMLGCDVFSAYLLDTSDGDSAYFTCVNGKWDLAKLQHSTANSLT